MLGLLHINIGVLQFTKMKKVNRLKKIIRVCFLLKEPTVKLYCNTYAQIV